MNPKSIFVSLSILITATICYFGYYNNSVFWLFLIAGPLILLGTYDLIQKKHTIKRNFPVLGNIRYALEKIRPEIMQYFVETDTQGRPINRLFRSLVYQRAKKENDTTPFGTQMNVYDEGYSWMEHSIYANHNSDVDHNPRVEVGGKECKQPYSASILNISAMSFGSLW